MPDKTEYLPFQTSKTLKDFMFLRENHYYGFKKITGILGKPNVCEFCHVGYTNVHSEFRCNCHEQECFKHCKHCFDIGDAFVLTNINHLFVLTRMSIQCQLCTIKSVAM